MMVFPPVGANNHSPLRAEKMVWNFHNQQLSAISPHSPTPTSMQKQQ
jgi:hypothetical protein